MRNILAQVVIVATMVVTASCSSSAAVVATQTESTSTVVATPTAVSPAPTPASTSVAPEPTLAPTAVAPAPTPAPTAAPAATAVADPVYGELPTWDEMIAGQPYADPGGADERANFDPTVDGIATTDFTTNVDGQLVDGEFVSDYPAGALTWRSELHVDPATRYAWYASDGVAEPGDGGCFELLEVDGVAHERTTFDGIVDFAPNAEIASAFDSFDEFADYEAGSTGYFASRDVSPTIIEFDNGFVAHRAVLTDADIQDAVDWFAGSRGGNNDYQVGALEVVVDNHGQLFSTTVWARYVGSIRQGADDERRPLDTTYSHATSSVLAADYEQRTLDGSLFDSGFCRPPTTDVVGTWQWRSLIVGGGELSRGFLEQMADAFIKIEADGSLSGSSGCRTFTGTSTIGFASLDDVAIDFAGVPCNNDGQFDDGDYEDLLVFVLSNDMSAQVDLFGRLFLVGIDGENLIIAHFGQD